MSLSADIGNNYHRNKELHQDEDSIARVNRTSAKREFGVGGPIATLSILLDNLSYLRNNESHLLAVQIMSSAALIPFCFTFVGQLLMHLATKESITWQMASVAWPPLSLATAAITVVLSLLDSLYSVPDHFRDAKPVCYSTIVERLGRDSAKVSSKARRDRGLAFLTSNDIATMQKVRMSSSVAFFVLVMIAGSAVSLLFSPGNVTMQVPILLASVALLLIYVILIFWPLQKQYRLWKAVWIDFFDLIGCSLRPESAQVPIWTTMARRIGKYHEMLKVMQREYTGDAFEQMVRFVSDIRNGTADIQKYEGTIWACRLQRIRLACTAPMLFLEAVTLAHVDVESKGEIALVAEECSANLSKLPAIALPRHYGWVIGTGMTVIAALQLFVSLLGL